MKILHFIEFHIATMLILMSIFSGVACRSPSRLNSETSSPIGDTTDNKVFTEEELALLWDKIGIARKAGVHCKIYLLGKQMILIPKACVPKSSEDELFSFSYEPLSEVYYPPTEAVKVSLLNAISQQIKLEQTNKRITLLGLQGIKYNDINYQDSDTWVLMTKINEFKYDRLAVASDIFTDNKTFILDDNALWNSLGKPLPTSMTNIVGLTRITRDSLHGLPLLSGFPEECPDQFINKPVFSINGDQVTFHGFVANTKYSSDKKCRLAAFNISESQLKPDLAIGEVVIDDSEISKNRANNRQFVYLRSTIEKINSGIVAKIPQLLKNMLEALTKTNIDILFNHYKKLFEDTAELSLFLADAIGISGYDYASAGFENFYGTSKLTPNNLPVRLSLFNELLEPAYKEIEAHPTLSFDAWVDAFSSKMDKKAYPNIDKGELKKIGLLTILSSLGFENFGVRTYLEFAARAGEFVIAPSLDRFYRNNLYSAIDDKYYSMREWAYSAGVFEPNAFGLPLEGSYTKFTKDKQNAWGKAYKVISGINLALALFDRGYQAKDIHFAVRNAYIMYEANDTLCDHLKLVCLSGMAQDTSGVSEGSKFYKEFETLINVPQNLNLKTDLMFELAGFGNNYNLLKNFRSFFAEGIQIEALNGTAMLIAYIREHERRQEIIDPELEKLLQKYPMVDGFLRASVDDVNKSMSGAYFVTEVLSSAQPRSPAKAIKGLNLDL